VKLHYGNSRIFAIETYLRSIMRKSVQRTAIEDIVSVERSLRIFRITFAHSKRFLTAFRICSETSATNRMSTVLDKKTEFLITFKEF